MKKIKLDKYDMILEKMGYGINNSNDISEIETDVDNDSLTKLMNEIGIKMSNNSEYNLVIYNDDVNDMMHVVLALYEICNLDNEESMRVMMEAHMKGKAVAKSGTFEEMNRMKMGLNKRNIEATVEN
jgi:ATP-dependent Clp protease adapter protein ClpS